MIDINKLNEALKELEMANPDMFVVEGSVSEECIQSVEAQLNIKFCKDYREFLAKYGYVASANMMVCGIDPKDPDCLDGGLVLTETNKFREKVQDAKKSLTVLLNESDSFYYLVENDSSEVYDYDLVSATFTKRFDSVEEGLLHIFYVNT